MISIGPFQKILRLNSKIPLAILTSISRPHEHGDYYWSFTRDYNGEYAEEFGCIFYVKSRVVDISNPDCLMPPSWDPTSATLRVLKPGAELLAMNLPIIYESPQNYLRITGTSRGYIYSGPYTGQAWDGEVPFDEQYVGQYTGDGEEHWAEQGDEKGFTALTQKANNPTDRIYVNGYATGFPPVFTFFNMVGHTFNNRVITNLLRHTSNEYSPASWGNWRLYNQENTVRFLQSDIQLG